MFVGDVSCEDEVLTSTSSFCRLFAAVVVPRRAGGRHLQIVAKPPPAKFSRTLDTLWSVDSQEIIVNLMPPDVSF